MDLGTRGRRPYKATTYNHVAIQVLLKGKQLQKCTIPSDEEASPSQQNNVC